MTIKSYNSIDEYIAEHISADALPSALGRGLKRAGTIFAKNFLGMNSMEQVLDGQKGQAMLANEFLGYAQQQGWDKSRYTMGQFLQFCGVKWGYTPDQEAMLQIADFAKHTWGNQRESFERAARIVMESSNALTSQEKTILNKIQTSGHMDLLVKARNGETLSSDDVRLLGGYAEFEVALGALEKVGNQPDQAAAGGNGDQTPPGGGDDASEEEDFGPDDATSMWEKLKVKLPGRNAVMNRNQLDKLSHIVARDMLRNLMMKRNSDAGDEGTAGPEGKDSRRNPSRESVSLSGTIVSIDEFISLAKSGSAGLATLKNLEILGEKHYVGDVYTHAIRDPNIGEGRSIVVLAAFAMALRLKKETRRPTDSSYNGKNQYIACRPLTELLMKEGVGVDVMTKLDEIGESSNDINSVVRALSAIPAGKLHMILGCLAKSMRIMSSTELKQAIEGTNAAV